MTLALPLTGGCQCGAVRCAVTQPPHGADVCHCRMCQRAVGQPFMAVFQVKPTALTWTRGQAKSDRSSNVVERSNCGSPPSFRHAALHSISLMITSLDGPEAVRPLSQYCIESRLDWTDSIAGLPAKTLADDPPPGGADGVVSCQFDPKA